MPENTITSVEALYTLYKQPHERAEQKEIHKLDAHCRRFIALSPYVILGTSGNDGTADASPRGDAPGFVQVLDDNTVLIPDRPGNNRLDSMRNIVENPAVGLLFLLPGVRETLRINGDATITTDPALLEAQAVKGKLPTSIIRIDVKSAYMHCGKSIIRSRLWDPASQEASEGFPSLGKILADQIDGLNARDTDENLEEAYKSRLY